MGCPPYSILPPHQMQHEPHQRVASPVGDSIPEPRPEAHGEPPGECPAPWATVLPTSLPRHESPRLLVLAPRAAAVLVQAGDVVLVLMRAPRLRCGDAPRRGPPGCPSPLGGAVMGQR